MMLRSRVGRTRSAILNCYPLIIAFICTTSCSQSAAPDPVTFEGTWIGVFKFIQDTGQVTLRIEADKACSLSGSVSGNIETWDGFYKLQVEGCLIIQSDNSVMGQVTLIRYRTGIDTLQTEAVMSGQFNLMAAVVHDGLWSTVEGAPFSAGGRWGAKKQP